MPSNSGFRRSRNQRRVIGHLFAHAAPGGGFKYDQGRYASLTPVIENCTNTRYADLLNSDMFERLAMFSSVPGAALATPTPQDVEIFTPPQLARFADVLRRSAVPYRVTGGRATKSELPPLPLDAATGVVTTVRDLEKFDLALRDNLLLSPQTRQAAWSNVIAGDVPLPTGFGWFVQNVRWTAAGVALRSGERRVVFPHPEGAEPRPDVHPARQQRRPERAVCDWTAPM